MKRSKGLIALMLAASVGIGFSALAGCSKEKSEEELNCENEIRKLLEYDANINIDKNNVQDFGFKMSYYVTDNKEYLIKFVTSKVMNAVYYLSTTDCDVITYSVDKDFYYNFKNEYSSNETQKEVDMVTELTTIYDPVEIIENGKEKEIINNLN